jgi:hypothetical protein
MPTIKLETYYAFFDGPARWKAGIRIPQDTIAQLRLNLHFKIREQGPHLAAAHVN